MWTNAYGATSSSTTIAARGSRRRFRPLTESPHVVNTNSSPSSANHTGITCGCPLDPLVASLAVRVPWLRKARISSEVIARGMCSPVCRSGPGRRLPSVPFVHAFQHPTCSAVAESEGTHHKRASRRNELGVFEEFVDRPLVVRMLSVLDRSEPTIRSDQEIGRQPEGTSGGLDRSTSAHRAASCQAAALAGRSTLRARGPIQATGGAFGLPADFLIAPAGRLVAAV